MIQKTITPKDKIANLSFEIPKNYVGKALEEIVDYIAFEKKQPLNAVKIGNGINKA
ncbi:hypothetical protein [Flavobacterium johnsoniae]|uniref:hypothetical protein n=1 Tax=Flavobacterium johnsoniae TaxID=986 RepID=UPI0013F4C83A|nr:hypothetical protein [Flavobacterium johnsoniae]